MSATADAIREALIADGFDRPAYGELITHNPSALTDRECGAVLAWALLAEVDRLTADLAALRIEHEAVCGLLTHTRRDMDEAREANIQAVKDNISMSASVDVLDETVAGLKAQRDEARRERDDARDETTRLWDATAADRVRTAELESRPTYEDGVRDGLKAAGRSCRLAELALRAKGGVETSAIGARDCALIIDEIDPGAVVALLEPKP